MRIWVVALQLLTSTYWLAVILPPFLQGLFHIGAVYGDIVISQDYSKIPHQGRKFGGYRIIPKPCKLSSSSYSSENAGVCMFNYECLRKGGTVIGSCMDGFLYGTCCKLPSGVSVATVTAPSTSSTFTTLYSTDKASTLGTKTHIFHSPQETLLFYRNGSVVENSYNPEDYHFSKPSSSHTGWTTAASVSTSERAPPRPPQLAIGNVKPATSSSNENGLTIAKYPQHMNPSQIFDLAMSLTMKNPHHANEGEEDRSTSTATNRPLGSTTMREPFSPDFSSSKLTGTNPSFFTLRPTNAYFQHHAKFNFTQGVPPFFSFGSASFADKYNTKPHSSDQEDKNLIRIQTLTVDNSHKNSPFNDSTSPILWMMNETKKVTTTEGTTTPLKSSSAAPQSLYTWLSIQGGPSTEKITPPGYSALYNSPPSPLNSFSKHPPHKPSTNQATFHQGLPSTTMHHIPGPSFYVTPEVKITPKPSPSAEVAPTVIVLTSANAPSKKPTLNFHLTPSNTSNENNYNHQQSHQTYKPINHYSQDKIDQNDGNNNNNNDKFDLFNNQPTKRPPPFVNAITISAMPHKPSASVLITAKPIHSYSTTHPVSSGYISKPLLPDKPIPSNFGTSSANPIKSTHVTSTIVTSIKPAANSMESGHFPPFLQSTVVTTAKPIQSGIVKPTLKPAFGGSISHASDSSPALSTSSYITIKPVSSTSASAYISNYRPLPQQPPNRDSIDSNNDNNGNINFYPYYPQPPPPMFFNSTEDLVAFPPVRDPNGNFTASQQEKPMITTTTTFGEGDTPDGEVAPQFIVDKTLEDKVHFFVEKIVYSLRGNFEDLEKVLMVGESTNNVSVETGAKKKPSSVKKPSYSSTGSVNIVTKKPSKNPEIGSSTTTATLLVQPSTTATTISIPSKRPITSTTIHIPIGQSISPQAVHVTSASENNEEDNLIETTIKTITTEESEYRRECGIRPMARKNGRIVGGKVAGFGEWPWQVLVREATWLGLFTKNKCGGVLITNKYVITAAHCQPGFLANLVAVFGEYDISGETESKRSVSKNVRRVIVHRQYDAATFENDIALLELESPIQYDSHIVPICMPEEDDHFTGRMATVTGWGRLKYGGGVPSVLQEVQVPVIENRVCQEMFQTAGHSKVILSSFMCAGYANGQRDSCEGDSGGPLMIERPDGRWVLAATVSHGIKCAAPYLPGVYMRTTYYKPWLQTITGVE